MDDEDYDLLMEFLDVSHKVAPAVKELPETCDTERPNHPTSAQQPEAVTETGSKHEESTTTTDNRTVEASDTTSPTSSPSRSSSAAQSDSSASTSPTTSVGRLYCHVCKEHRSVESYWNCHKKNHLLNLFYSEQHLQLDHPTILRTASSLKCSSDADKCDIDYDYNHDHNYSSDKCNDDTYAITACIPHPEKYAFETHDNRLVIRKIKVKR